MKFCLECKKNGDGKSWTCPHCGFAPVKKEGVALFAPHLLGKDDVFDPFFFEKLFRLEATHFWFHHRSQVTVWAMQKYFANAQTFLEVGCGNGFLLSEIGKRCHGLRLTGADIHIEGLNFASSRLSGADFIQADAGVLPYESEFDLIGAFDVIEHIDRDEDTLRCLYRALNDGGGLLVTVPQHPFLWSEFDVASCHKRRYTASELRSKLEKAGFKVIQIGSLFSVIFPLLALVRVLKKTRQPLDPHKSILSELEINPFFNFVMTRIVQIELFLIKLGVRFPFGGSLFAIGIKEVKNVRRPNAI